MSQLMQIKNVHRVAHEADVPALLLSLGIHRATESASSSPLLSVHRHDALRHIDYYFRYNEGMVTPPNEPGNLFEPAEGNTLD